MRAGIRKKILEDVKILNDCYEPNVPTFETPKPYAVVVQGADSSSQDPTSFQRSVEVWIYNEMDSFQSLDSLADEVIKSLDLQTFTDPNTNISYTASYNGTLGAQDIIDEEWKAIVRGLSFNVISLYNSNTNSDNWEKSIADFINKKVNVKTYDGTWRKDFQVPSVLCRTINSNLQGINYSLYKQTKDMRIHVVGHDKGQIDSLINDIERELITSIKVPLIEEDRRFLIVESIREDRTSSMLGVGQITVSLSRLQRIDRGGVFIEKIYGRNIQEE